MGYLSDAPKRATLVTESTDALPWQLLNTADAVVALLEPIQARFRELRQDETHLQAILAAGAQKARERAEKTLTSVYDVVGFVPRA